MIGFFNQDNLEAKLGRHIDGSYRLVIEIFSPTEHQEKVLGSIVHHVKEMCAKSSIFYEMAMRAKPHARTPLKGRLEIEFDTTFRGNIGPFIYVLMGAFNFVVDFEKLLVIRPNLHPHQKQALEMLTKNPVLRFDTRYKRRDSDAEELPPPKDLTLVKDVDEDVYRPLTLVTKHQLTREVGGNSPTGVSLAGLWVYRVDDVYVDHDGNRSDLAERNNLELIEEGPESFNMVPMFGQGISRSTTYRSFDRVYSIKQEYGGTCPKYTEIQGHWVLRRAGVYVDHDNYIDGLLGRHTLRGAHYANKS